MKKIFIFFVIIFIIFCLFKIQAEQCLADSFFEGLKKTAETNGIGYSPIEINKSGVVLAKIIGSVFAPIFTGVVGMLFLIYAGYVWMMSHGDEQEVEKARTIITNTLIALVVIYSTWAIITFIIPLWKFINEVK